MQGGLDEEVEDLNRFLTVHLCRCLCMQLALTVRICRARAGIIQEPMKLTWNAALEESEMVMYETVHKLFKQTGFTADDVRLPPEQCALVYSLKVLHVKELGLCLLRACTGFSGQSLFWSWLWGRLLLQVTYFYSGAQACAED